MSKGVFMTREDFEESAKLQRRQQFEHERKKRIFDTKQRVLGIDSAYLNRQIYEHQEKLAKERELQRLHDEELKRQHSILCHHEMEQQKLRHAIESEINYYRCHYQRKEQRREYDLNDTTEAASRRKGAGISSAQIFDGEDLGYNERHRRQIEQQRAWLEQQIREREQAKVSREQADNERSKTAEEHASCQKRMLESERRMRARLSESINEYNKQLANVKQFERERAKREKTEDDLAEIYNMLSSDILAENPAAGKSCIDPNKRLPYMYRGMTSDELMKFQLECEQQRREKRAELEIAKTKQSSWEAYQLECDRELKLKDLEAEQRRRKALNELFSYNRELAMKQRRERDENDLKLKKNSIKDEFFRGFNTTTR